MMQAIYLDNSASTPVLPAVWEAMRPYFLERAGNPASSHTAGRHARRALEDARERIAALVGAWPDEVIFTSGATEANNLAVFGLAVFGVAGEPPGHLLASPIEHPCVKEPLVRLAASGLALDWLAVSAEGVVTPAMLDVSLRPETRLVCVMLANHETGAIQPIQELVRLAGRVAFHCDAAATAGKMPISFHDLGVTSLTLSAHKFHGPKGVGALLVKRHAPLRPQLWGGHQQQGRRPGTEPVALAVGMATALDLACTEMVARRESVRLLRQSFLDVLREGAAPIVINGPDDAGLPHLVNVSFPGCRADVLLMSLDLAGVACATGSACSSGSLLPSPVLAAMGRTGEVLHSAMRFSFSHLLSEPDIIEAARRIGEVVRKQRAAVKSGSNWPPSLVT